MHLSHNTMLYSIALRYLVDESIYMHQVHVNISITGCGNRYLSICTLMIAHYCTLSLSAIWMAKMWATWHLKYRIQCRCTLSPCQPSSQYRIQCITGGAFRRLPQLGSLALQNNDIAGSWKHLFKYFWQFYTKTAHQSSSPGLKRTVFSSVASLTSVELEGNPLHCDCRQKQYHIIIFF